MRTTFGRLALAMVLALFGGWAGAGGGVAHADEEAQPLSAAEQAFKDAWWAETGGGNLNEALALYEQAAAAEGPAGVKAKALYRRAVLQQRIGKTQEAIQTLERLAKEHPGETQLQADARARLEEWTAVDLRTGFPEWYRRFQYGPEFQAKILDLVLKLGSSTAADIQSAQQEILTIGEPAIPALKAHLGSRNSQLASRVVELLLQLGVVPDEIVDHHGAWMTWASAWDLILDLPGERRAVLLARMGSTPEYEPVEPLRAALQGPPGVVEWLARAPAPHPNSDTSSRRTSLQRQALARIETSGLTAERVRALVAAGVPDPAIWQGFARWLIEKGLVTRADVDAWAKLPWDTAATVRIQAVDNGKLFPPLEALEVLKDVIGARPVNQGQNHRWLLDALVARLPTLPWPEALDDVARILGPLWLALSQYAAFGTSINSPDERVLDAFGRAFELARDPALISACGGFWMQHGAGRPQGTATLFRWAREGALSAHRQLARRQLFAQLGDRDLDAVVDLLVKPEAVDDDMVFAWQQLLDKGPHTAALYGDAPRAWRLLDRIAAVPQAELARAQRLAILMVSPIKGGQVPPSALLDRWLEQPERFPAPLFASKADDLAKSLGSAGQLPALRRAFRERWAAGTHAQREGLLAGLGVLDARADPEMQAFLRDELAAQPRRIPPAWRYSVIAQLLELTVADIRAFYDLTQPADVDEAAGWVLRTQWLPILKASPEAFEALRLAFRPEGPQADLLAVHFERFEAVQRDVLAALLAHEEPDARLHGTRLLVGRSAPADADLWVRALKDSSVMIRTEAAKNMQRVPTPVTIKALVTALDDPHPDVRAAALESLDAIQKMEDLKARWREKVK